MSGCCDETPPPLLLAGVTQFNRGEFFEQHETLEDLWLDEPRDIRRLYQGILQIGVAMHHISRCNHHGAVHMLTRGPNYLQPFTPTCQTIDVNNLLDQADRILCEVKRLGPNNLKQFNWALAPKVRLITP
tara:strand:+ start:336 stop:725 length:390 start_codon:yes stop_codon:yes gene_type:complete